MWYQWVSISDFDSWHADTCGVLGIPYPNHNQATGEIDENAQWTTAYTEAVVVAEGDVRAYVEDRVAELVPDRLGQPCEPPPVPDVAV